MESSWKSDDPDIPDQPNPCFARASVPSWRWEELLHHALLMRLEGGELFCLCREMIIECREAVCNHRLLGSRPICDGRS